MTVAKKYGQQQRIVEDNDKQARPTGSTKDKKRQAGQAPVSPEGHKDAGEEREQQGGSQAPLKPAAERKQADTEKDGCDSIPERTVEASVTKPKRTRFNDEERLSEEDERNTEAGTKEETGEEFQAI